VSATDYDGNGITNSTGPLSSSAQFSSETQLFSWTPNYSQTGIYTIVFYAHDNDPLDPKTGQMEVVILELFALSSSSFSFIPVKLFM
jgi:hypothetical protein